MNAILSVLTGSRKLIVIVMYMTIMVVMRCVNMMNGTEFADNLQLGVVAFMGTNLGEHLISGTKEWLITKSNNSIKPLAVPPDANLSD